MAATPTSKPTPNSQAPRDTALPAGNPAIAALTTWADSVDSASSANLTNSAGLIGRLTSSADSAPSIGVAYSGGADSTALLLAAHCLWPDRVHALHIHHGLQAAADDFVRVCTLTCDRLAVPLTVLHVDARPAKGDSPEDAARQSRYVALSQAAKSAG
ncbi:MAG: hypothetical protein H7Z77_00660, partial [Chitinophagaceae bacterium]|nr:hypothetical protein [Polaromonas sp.]